MIYTQQQKDSILYQSQVWLGELGIKLEALERSMQPCDDLYCNGYRVRTYMTALQVADNLTDKQQEHIYTCMAKITGVKDYPVATPIISVDAPDIIIGEPGPPGPPGQDGQDGTSANIDVRSEIDSILVEETQEGEVKVYTLKDNTYIPATVTLALDPATSVIEIGNVLAVTMNINLLKGRDNVLASTILSPAGVDAAYQAILDLPSLNAGGSSGRSVVASGIVATTNFQVNIDDNTELNQASVLKTFVYPFFWGSTPNEPINPYSDLTKVIQTKGTKNVPYADSDAYYWFCYPASYGDLSSIKDQNGFEVLGSFTKIVDDVTSTGLDNNWTESYNIYRTTAKTDITGTYVFSF